MLEMKHLSISFYDSPVPTKVLTDFSMTMAPGEILGIVGESGSGKTMMALALMGLLKKAAKIESGEVLWEGKDLLCASKEELRNLRGNEISMIFQEPMTSLNPVLPVGEQVEESLKIHTQMKKEERKARALEVMQSVELPNPRELYDKFPHQLSGGMRQRVMIASALVQNPKLMIADEPTTALDVTIQAEILKLLKKINREKKTAILFISHDLGVVRKLCDKVLVMHNGVIVEQGEIEALFANPREEYTKKLLSSIPTRETRLRRRNYNE